MWTAAGVQESALAVVIISREDVDRETLRERGCVSGGGVGGCDLKGPIRTQVESRPHAV